MKLSRFESENFYIIEKIESINDFDKIDELIKVIEVELHQLN
jgi:hypothetical protein